MLKERSFGRMIAANFRRVYSMGMKRQASNPVDRMPVKIFLSLV